MGTFIIRPTVQASGGTPIVDDGSIPSDYAGWSIIGFPGNTLLAAMQGTTDLFSLQFNAFADSAPNSGNDTVRFDFTGACIYLDGSLVPVTFASLASGFTPDSASVKINIDSVQQPSGMGSASYNLQQSSSDDGPTLTNTFPYVFTPTPPSMLDIVSNGCGLKVACNCASDPDVAGVQLVYNLRVEGTYHIVTYTFSLDTTSPIHPGDPITISTDPDDPDHLPIGDIDDVTISGGPDTVHVPPADFITQSPEILVLVLPYGLPDGPIDIFVVIHGDPVPIGTLTVLFADGSGVYTLVRGKTSDTVYTHEATATNDIAIPMPFFKTGFIGG